jgi:hypothetical protein
MVLFFLLYMERAKAYRAADMKMKAMTHGIALGQRFR